MHRSSHFAFSKQRSDPQCCNVKMAASWQWKFNIPVTLDVETLPNKNEKVCVVAVVGKSNYNAKSCKASVIDDLVQRQVFQNWKFEEKDTYTECELECYYSVSTQVLYVHLIGIFDAYNVSVMCKKISTELSEKGYLHVFSSMKFKYAKALLMLFSISHIVLVIHPGSSFDVTYLHLFRTLDTVRQKLQPHLSELLVDFPISSEWIQAGRPCSPRTLFIFQSCPLDFRNDGAIADGSVRSKVKSQKLPPIKKLEHALEDQIYRILRKSRIITNISGNSLFAIPANQEFVYVVTSTGESSDVIGFLLNQLREQCIQAETKDAQSSAADPKAKTYQLSRRSPSQSGRVNSTTRDEHSFHSFVWQHIELAHTRGFDDNVGRHPIPAYFELPSCKTWFDIANKMYAFFIEDNTDVRGRNTLNSLRGLIDIDGRFSEGRCGKVLPIASAAYQENLPPHYTLDYHKSKLGQALRVFTLHARGPAFEQYATQLREECERIWKNGRQLCEVISLTGNHCINPLHRLTDSFEDDLNGNVPVMPHASQYKLTSACDCGRQQATRDDPFDAKTGNHDFYDKLHEDCCGSLERIDFPIFQPSIKDFKAAHVLPTKSILTPLKRETPTRMDRDSVSTPTMSLPLSLGQSVESDALAEESAPHLSPTQEHSQSAEREEVVIDTPAAVIDTPAAVPAQKVEKPLVRQPSTTEYLPGMLHTESPCGLLPKYPSWSLVCLGPSSLYSHNIGIQDQPGFIPGTNFLLPWDVTVKMESKEKWPAISEVSGKKAHLLKTKKGTKDFSELTVKIFLGVEYECSRGHRFMCSAPDKVLKATGTGLVKDNASKITSSDMPLYFPCPCRSGKTLIAQLMRIHIVTPKAPVHVTLNPCVQPCPLPCPVFCPGNPEPVKLSQSAYWILRLPFVYVGEMAAYSPPKEMMSALHGRLLKGLYGIAEVGAGAER